MTDAPIFWTWVSRDDEMVRLLRCPVCGVWGEIDDDQFHGYISIEHSVGPDDLHPDEPHGESGCSFHETIDVAHQGEFVKPAHCRQLRWTA